MALAKPQIRWVIASGSLKGHQICLGTVASSTRRILQYCKGVWEEIAGAAAEYVPGWVLAVYKPDGNLHGTRFLDGALIC